MASCSYSSLLENDSTSCGAKWKNPEDFQCIALKDCSRDVLSHLRAYKLVHDMVQNEVQLLLVRAGNYWSSLIYFPSRHVNTLNKFFYWRVAFSGRKSILSDGKNKYFWPQFLFRKISARVDIGPYIWLKFHFDLSLIHIWRCRRS